MSEAFDNHKLPGAKLSEAIVLLGLLAQVTTHALGALDWEWGRASYYLLVSITSAVYSALNGYYAFSIQTDGTRRTPTPTEQGMLVVVGGVVFLALGYGIHQNQENIQVPSKLVAWAGGVAVVCIVNLFAADNGPYVYYHFHHGLIAWLVFAVFVAIGGDWAMYCAVVALGVMIHGGATWGSADFEFALGSTGVGLKWYWHAVTLVLFVSWTFLITGNDAVRAIVTLAGSGADVPSSPSALAVAAAAGAAALR